MTLPILYTFRRCPYAIRARLALKFCGAQCELREVVLKNKPEHMLSLSSKGTVPVLLLPVNGNRSLAPRSNNNSNSVTESYRVIDESIDIMQWAMHENSARDRQNAHKWLTTETMSHNEINELIEQNDGEFKSYLDKYKYSDRHPEHPQVYYLQQSMPFLERLEATLCHSAFLGGSQFRFLDAAILPFIRQFSMVEPKQFNALALPKLQKWLACGLESDLFTSVMQKQAQWTADSGQSLL